MCSAIPPLCHMFLWYGAWPNSVDFMFHSKHSSYVDCIVIFSKPLLHYGSSISSLWHNLCIYFVYINAVCPGKVIRQFRKARWLWSGPSWVKTPTNRRDMEMCLLAASTIPTSDYLSLCHSFPSFFLQWDTDGLAYHFSANDQRWESLQWKKISIKPGIQAKSILYNTCMMLSRVTDMAVIRGMKLQRL